MWHKHVNTEVLLAKNGMLISGWKIKHLIAFHNLNSYDSHFIRPRVGNFDKKINAIQNTSYAFMHFYQIMQKKKTFMIVKFLTFIEAMQFMNSNLQILDKNLPKDKFKYSSEEF